MAQTAEMPSSPWSSGLSPEISAAVLRRLPSHADRVRFAAVCRPWRAAARQRRHQPPPLPWLALPDGTFFSAPSPDEFRFPDAANYSGATCGEWLLFDDDDDGLLRLTDPFTEKTRLLPSLSGIRVLIDDEQAATGAPSPWRDADKMSVRKMIVCGDGLNTAVVGREYFARVAVCSLRSFSWSLCAGDRWRWYEDMAFRDGKLYALTGSEDLLAFDVGVELTTGEASISGAEHVVQGPLPPHSMAMARYLVRSRGGALLMVRRLMLQDKKTTAVRFSVFRADLASARWEETSTLGGEALFVGRLCSRAVRAHDAVRGDLIFFVPDSARADMAFWEEEESRRRAAPHTHHAAVYDMRDGTVGKFLARQKGTDGPAPATWLFPDPDDEDDCSDL